MGFSGQGALAGAAMGAPIPFIGPAGGALLGGFFGGSKKVTGVPTPQQRTGTEIGADYKGFLDTAYPGTTPWEQLGANSPMGAIESGENQVKQQVKMQERELYNRSALQTQQLNNQTQVADQTNRAHIITSLGALSPQAAQQGLNILNNSTVSPYDTKTQQDREKTGPDIQHTNSQTNLNIANKNKTEAGTPENTIRGQIAEGIMQIFKGTGIGTQQLTQNALNLNNKAGNFLENLYNKHGQILKNASDRVYNRGSKPRRFA